MVDGLSKIISALVAALLLFVYPITYMADNQEESMRLLVQSATVQFVDTARDNGYITKAMYDDFLDQIALTGCGYDVSLEHSHKAYVPIYSDLSDPTSFTGDYEMMASGFFTDEIEGALDTSGIYYMSREDFILVEVINTTKTFSTQVKTMVFGKQIEVPSIWTRYGGQVRYENY